MSARGARRLLRRLRRAERRLLKAEVGHAAHGYRYLASVARDERARVIREIRELEEWVQ